MRKILAEWPGDVALRVDYAQSLLAVDDLETAAAEASTALACDPGLLRAWLVRATALRGLGQTETAIGCYRRVIELRPGFAGAHINLGNALFEHGMYQEGIANIRQAIALNPASADAHNNLGTALQETGALDEALAAFETAVDLAPGNGMFYRMLVNTGRLAPGDARFRRLEALVAGMDCLPESARLEIHFALGAAYSDFGEPGKSCFHVNEGNRLKRHCITYDEARCLQLFARIQQAYPPGTPLVDPGQGLRGQGPVFVVGMPRSGTTLVEQILSSHSGVYGSGEITVLPRVVQEIEREPVAGTFRDEAGGRDRAHLARLGAAYLVGIRKPAPLAERIVDKLPDNFLRIGLIHQAIPGARIVHVTRDPVDTCLSCYSKLFRYNNVPFSYHLAELGRYYRAYRGLMAHWREILPEGTILDVAYEDIVADLEGQARRLLAFCDLPRSDACLTFERTQRTVRTASSAQARQPLYATSVGRWHTLRTFAAPLIDALGPWALSGSAPLATTRTTLLSSP